MRAIRMPGATGLHCNIPWRAVLAGAFLAVSQTAWSQNATTASAIGVTPEDVVNTTLGSDADNGVQNLFDGFTDDDPEHVAGDGNAESFSVEIDLGTRQDLAGARLFGDTAGSWVSSTWSLEYKAASGDTYQTAFDNAAADGDQWFEENVGVSARFVRVTVDGNSGSGSVQANELEIWSAGSDSSDTDSGDSGGADSGSGDTDSGEGDSGDTGSDDGGSGDTGSGSSDDGTDDSGGDTGETGDVTGTGVLDAQRRAHWSAGVDGGVPAWSSSISVTDYGAVADDDQDDSTAFQAAIDNAPANSAVHVPSGTYNLDDGLSMRSGVVLRGAGAESTELRFNHSGSAVNFNGGSSGTAVRATGGYDKGSTAITVEEASQFDAGGYAVLTQQNDPDAMYTDSSWNVSWASRSAGQVVRVTGVEGNTVSFSDPLNFSFSGSLDPQLEPVSMLTDAGLESVRLTRDDGSDTFMIVIDQAADVWLRNVISEQPNKGHVQANRVHRCEIRGSYFNDAQSHGGGGHGYGVALESQVTGCLVENNIFRRLRHSIVLHLGANGNVFGYNYSREPTWEYSATPPDISLHGHWPFANLFEGNVVQNIHSGDYWGPSGPWNTFLRNRVEDSDLTIDDHSDLQNIVGNVVRNGDMVIDGTVDQDTLIIHGNRVNGSVGDDPDVADGTPVPDSYYRSDKPAFYGDMGWPSVGPTIGNGTNPAKQRYDTGAMTP